MKKMYITIAVVLAIIAAIAYLESSKPEQVVGDTKEISILDTTTDTAVSASQANATAPIDPARLLRIKEKDDKYPKAVELAQPDGYLNAEPFNLSDNIGKKVILVDFWTYSCINCQRTIPYLAAWDKKYSGDGLLIVGVHTPEFDFEKERDNVQRAIEKFDISYAVVQDNEYRTWRAYGNRYWPRKYIIDIDGFIVYDHIGEGSYAETESVIQKLLAERKQVLNESGAVETTLVERTVEAYAAVTPEIYFGYGYSRNQFGNKEGWKKEESFTYDAPTRREANMFYVDGPWRSGRESMVSGGNGTVYLQYAAASINLVAGTTGEAKEILVSIDDEPARKIMVRGHDLYSLAETSAGTHTLKLTVPSGVELFTFTFG